MLDIPQTISAPTGADIVSVALAGLLAPRKTLPPALFYDEEGCRLFERITKLPEYYPTRTELALLPRVAADISRIVAPGASVVEYGAGSESKAAILLAALRAPAAWLPVDVAAPSLERAAMRLRRQFPEIAVLPIEADFLKPLVLPSAIAGGNALGFFPGSTIGNLDRTEANLFLRRAARTLGDGARFLIGVDLPKSKPVLLAAYDDAQGVTAAFNRNLLRRLNREAGADFDPSAFAHRVVWNAAESRIEMHLVSMCDQHVHLGGAIIRFVEGETIHTENSHKYSPDAFRTLATAAGWTLEFMWTDPGSLFALHLLVC